MKKIKQYLFWFILGLTALVGCEKDYTGTIKILDDTRSELTVRLQQNSALIHHVYTDTTLELHPGVTETDIHYQDANGHTMRIFILEADMNQPDVKLRPLTPNDATAYARQSIPDMVEYIAPSTKVLFGCNADFFNATTGEPRGIVYLSGQAVRTTIPAGWTFFGLSKTGQLMIGDDSDYQAQKADIFHALGGHQTLVKDGEPVSHTDTSVEPRTAVGFTNDNKLYFVVVDGRKYDYSYGINFTDLGQLMHALGVKESVNLDGGGSSTFLINNSVDMTYEVRNRPSDGTPRAVANGWAITVSEN
ncbi:phosphodiester glycosidase family protein [Olivibacter domesticus]|uniref:Phosphodiester glycosidase domain-containing protein n=1 Tax=Olivibacter domesticus TaxID=407022 RepID=A0A1H7U5K5_OLID1|nr:phosphodiester glycosidase family protein [Olivibacter domesticus]SEL92035.1 Predicted protein [Olivibacter domesticus]